MKTAFRFAFALLLTVAFLGASVAAAGVGLTAYSVTPTVVKPGTHGVATLTLSNSGSATAQQVTLSYSSFTGAGPQSIFVGDIGAGGSTVVSVPFDIPADFTPRVVQLELQLSTGASSSTVSIPITVSDAPVLQVRTLSVSKPLVKPGDAFNVTVDIYNDAGDARNVRIGYPSGSTFQPLGVSQLNVGNIPRKTSVQTVIPFKAGAGIASGAYNVNITLTAEDVNGQASTGTVGVGPVVAVTNFKEIAVSATTDKSTASPGDQTRLTITVQNLQDVPVSGVTVSLSQLNASLFTVLGDSEQQIESINPGDTKTVSFDLGINPTALATYYPLTVNVAYQSPNKGSTSVDKTTGIQIAGQPAFGVILTTTPSPVGAAPGTAYTVSLQVSNTGNAPVRALAVSINSDELEILGAANGYIGTLNVDDYSTPQFQALVKHNVKPGTYNVHVMLTYKDTFNQARAQTLDAPLQIVTDDVYQAAQTKTNGGSPLLWIILLVVLGALAWFGYKRLRQKPAATAKP